MRRLSRRTALGLAGVAAVGVPLAATAACSREQLATTGKLLRSTAKLPRPFTVPLPVPPALEPRRRGGADTYELT